MRRWSGQRCRSAAARRYSCHPVRLRTDTARSWCPERLLPARARRAKWRGTKNTRRSAAIFYGAAVASFELRVACARKLGGDGHTKPTDCRALFSQAFATRFDVKERSSRAPERSDSHESPGHRDIVCIRACGRRQRRLQVRGEKGNYFSTCFVGSSPRRCGGTKAVLAVCSPSRMRTS